MFKDSHREKQVMQDDVAPEYPQFIDGMCRTEFEGLWTAVRCQALRGNQARVGDEA